MCVRERESSCCPHGFAQELIYLSVISMPNTPPSGNVHHRLLLAQDSNIFPHSRAHTMLDKVTERA